MPLSRYQVRNEFSLADPELYRAADKDDPEALLEGVAMAGLVGVLRQLGDLAEFAAEIFHDLHEEVMVTAARGHTLMARVQQLESEFPPIEKAFLSQTNHSTFFGNAGIDWHPNLRTDQNLITKGDLPRFVMDSYEECRGPPRLFLLDKFDVAGAGACLKRYTDPSFYKVEASAYEMTSTDVQRDKRIRKAKKKGPRWKNGETPEVLPSTKLHQLFLEERVENCASDPARLVKLKRRQNASAFGSDNGRSYMEKFLKSPPEDKMVCEVFVGSSPLKLAHNNPTGPGLENQVLDISSVGSDFEPVQRNRSPYPPPSLGTTVSRLSEDDFGEDIAEERTSEQPISNPSSDDKEISVNGEVKVDNREIYQSDDDNVSEIDDYTDALATLESEVETDAEFRGKNDEVGFFNTEKQGTDSDANDEQLQNRSQFSDSQSLANSIASDDGNSSIRKGVSSFSCSDTASTSAETAPAIGEADAPCIPSDQASIVEKVRVDPHLDHDTSNDDCIGQAEIHADSAPIRLAGDSGTNSIEDQNGGLESDDISSSSSEILSSPLNTELQMDENSDFSSGSRKTEAPRTDNIRQMSGGLITEEPPLDDNCENSGGPTETEEQHENLDDNSHKREDVAPTLSYEDPKDEAEVLDLTGDSSAGTDSPKVLEMVLEKEASQTSLDYAVLTKYAEDVSAGNAVDTPVMSPDSVISHAAEHPSVLPLAEFKICGTCNQVEEHLAEKADDDLSNEYDSAEISIADSGERGLDGTQNGELYLCGESDLKEGGIEPNMDLVASDSLSDFTASPDIPSKVDDYSLLGDRDNETIQFKAVVERASDSSLTETCAQSDEREHKILQFEVLAERASDSSLASEAKASLDLYSHTRVTLFSESTGQHPESESPCDSSFIEETELLSHFVPSVTSLGEKVTPQTGQFDLLLLNTPGESPQLSSQLEDIDSPSLMDPKTNSNTEFDSCVLTLPTHPLDQEKDLQAEEPDEGTLQVAEVTRPGSSPELEHIDSSVDMNHNTDINASFDSWALPLTTPPLDQEKELQDEVPDVGSLQLGEVACESSLSDERDETDNDSYPAPLSGEASMSERPQLSTSKSDLSGEVKIPLNSAFACFNLLPEVAQLNLEEMPPLPPLPPMQWRIGKLHHASERDGNQQGNLFPPLFPSKPNEHVEPSNRYVPLQGMNIENSYHEDLEGSMVNSTPLISQAPTVNHGDDRVDFVAVGQTQSSNLFSVLPVTYNERPQQTFPAEEGKIVQSTWNPISPAITQSPLQLSKSTPITQSPTSMYSSNTPHGEVTQSLHQLSTKVSVEEEDDHASVVSDMIVVEPPEKFVAQPMIENEQPEHVAPTSEEEIISLSRTAAVSSIDDEKPNGNRSMKLPRPRSPLIDAVAAHDKSKLRKVAERVRPQIQKVEERDSILEQIRTKSFNLKPAVAARPTIQGPRTNLRVAAILEKANAIRQAFAGSDDDDDDSWSDS